MKKSIFFLLLCTLCAAKTQAQQAQQGNTQTLVQYLSGRGFDDTVKWDFFCTAGQNSGRWTSINVPSCWEQQGFGAYTYGIYFYRKPTAPGISTEQGKYKLRFDVPNEWRGRRVRIVFDGVMTDAEVRINEQKAGTHQGGFYRFAFDITNMLKYGDNNLLEVNVSKESANESVNLAERRADYWNFGGIFRPVFLEIAPPLFVARSAVDAKADGSFAVDVFLSEASERPLSLAAQLVDADGAAVATVAAQAVPKGSDKLTLRTTLANPKLWTAETPKLYRVKITLSEGNKTLHETTTRFGFRTLELRPSDGVYLNGQRIILRGVNRHSFWPESGRTLSPALNVADVQLMREMNMNAVRMSHYPPDPEFLDACDELGLYVLDELGGWHGKYDEGVGRKLVAELVCRDVNHPSILFWDNGNEGGWNTELDNEFAKYDPQQRPVLHPQQRLSGVETMHYRSYGEMQEYLRGDYIYMPTEFLHGLYDGGHGAGLYDYWEMMRQHPRCAGGFLWAFADEGVVRTDQNGRIDNDGNHGADGIVGPHHEREGSFNTIREVWSPIQISVRNFASGSATLAVENRYDFTSFADCKVAWELGKFPQPDERTVGHKTLAAGEVAGLGIAPHEAGEISLALPSASLGEADVLYVSAKNPQGELLYTWSFDLPQKSVAKGADKGVAEKGNAPKVASSKGRTVVSAAGLELTFDEATGELADVKRSGKNISLRGIKFTAARRGNRTLDGSIDAEAAKGLNLVYKELPLDSRLRSLTTRSEGNEAVVEATYFGALQKVLWRISPGGDIRLDYEYAYDGVVELMGVKFDYPEASVKSMRMLARGPYRAWQNRLHGTTLDVWSNDYNDPIPGETFTYPEFKGYYSGWRWVVFATAEGSITLRNEGSQGSYFGVFTPRDGRDEVLYQLPQTGLAVLDVIPAVRNKVNATDLIGPSSQAQRVSGLHKGSLRLQLK
jgi:beta-galactosidase/beta-glucuronidase